MGAFRKFVEWGTGSPYVPPGTACAVCGRRLGPLETGFWSINAKQLSDGTLCKHCDEKLTLLLRTRLQWIPKARRKEKPYSDYTLQKKFLMDVHTAKLFLTSSEEFAREELAKAGTGHTSLFRMGDACFISPTATQVGVRRHKLLEGRLVLFGFVQLGTFRQGDPVLLLDGADQKSTTVLEAYAWDCEENTLDVMLRAHMGSQQLDHWQTGWLVLDTTDAVGKTAMVIG